MFDGSTRGRTRAQPRRSTIEKLVRSAAGGLLLRPWFDSTALRLLTRWYFPLSRGWAAALEAGGSPDRFCEMVPCGRIGRRLLPSVMSRLEVRRAALEAADTRWEAGFFGDGAADAALEAGRLRAAAALTNLRSAFIPLHLEHALPPVAFDVEPEVSVAHRHATRLTADAFADSFDPAIVEASRGFRFHNGIEGWVRFPAPSMPGSGAGSGSQAGTGQEMGPAETVWARVSAPEVDSPSGAGPMPSLIFTHGIAMETEFTGDGRNPLGALVDAGIRVIRPEGPWHGRRRLPGTYGGEPVLARGPGGMLDYFHAHAIELGRLVAWARATRGGPVAVGGVSLGALTAQLVAVAARWWPPEMCPDALFLVAPSRSLIAVAFEGSLTRALGVPHAIRSAGWSLRGIDRWRPLLEPVEPPVLPADRIIVVIGASDDVTLTAGGEALVSAWDLPEENVFRAPAGHFSTSLGLSRDQAPFRRLLKLLGK